MRCGNLMRTRSVLVSIDPAMPYPERRTGFAIADLESWIDEPRSSQRSVLAALLVLVASWSVAGCPEADVVPMRQFTRWARACGGFLAYHGVSGFLANAGELEDRDDDAADRTQLLARWYEIFGGGWVRSEQVRDSAGDPRWGGHFPEGRDGIPPPVRHHEPCGSPAGTGHNLTKRGGVPASPQAELPRMVPPWPACQK
jgi:hypothetical protein